MTTLREAMDLQQEAVDKIIETARPPRADKRAESFMSGMRMSVGAYQMHPDIGERVRARGALFFALALDPDAEGSVPRGSPCGLDVALVLRRASALLDVVDQPDAKGLIAEAVCSEVACLIFG